MSLKKLSGEASKKSILELTYKFDDTLGQWVNGTCDQTESYKNNMEIDDKYLLERSNEYGQNKANDLILNKTFSNILEDESNKKIESDLSNFKQNDTNTPSLLPLNIPNDFSKESNLKDVSFSKTKSIVNVKGLKSIFAAKETSDFQDMQDNSFYFFRNDSDLEDKNIFHYKKKSVDINNDFESNNKCFMDIGSLKFPLFFPHFDNKELYALS
ncbi:hypothetical protein PORY_000310, partial [Pneumocystis oryctolagi]